MNADFISSMLSVVRMLQPLMVFGCRQAGNFDSVFVVSEFLVEQKLKNSMTRRFDNFLLTHRTRSAALLTLPSFSSEVSEI